jgi:TatD DNase family protein
MHLKFFDSHCHPQLSAFDADRKDVLQRMEAQAVGGLVVGTDLEESRKAVDLAKNNDFLWAAAGFHPNDTPEESFDTKAFTELAHGPKVVAIGECGLDFYRGDRASVERVQQERFLKHIELARTAKKPLMIHCRPSRGTQDANEAMIEILKNNTDVRAVMHFFTATPAIAKQYIELGCYLSFPGVVTFTDMYDELILMTPMNKILSETDSPFAAPMPYRGKRNEPSYVIETVKKIAEIKDVPFEEIAMHIRQNASDIFGITL